MLSSWLLLLGAVALTLPALFTRLTGARLPSAPVEAIVFGVAVLGAAFLLAWAAEVAQLEISQALAIAALALIAVLPEYAVDLYFAWEAATKPEYVGYATANMTGANRLLIGFAWPLIVFLNWARSRRATIILERSRWVEVSFLAAATAYSFVMPLKGSISAIDAVVLITLFALYSWRLAHLESSEPELIGPARLVGAFPRTLRRGTTIGLFLFSGVVIFVSAEPFAEALIQAGGALGIDEFLLVQWLAPLASEAPEVIIASMWVLRLHATAGLSALLSSKVNQWTLLIGTLPLAFSLAGGRLQALPLDERQVGELFLTAAQSLFAVALLFNLRLALPGAGLLLVLFLVQLILPWTHQAVSATYLVLAAAVLVRSRTYVGPMLREGLMGRSGPATGAA